MSGNPLPRAHRSPPALVAAAAAVVGLWLVAAALPFLWTVWGSLKLEGDLSSLADRRDARMGPRTLAATGSRSTFEAHQAVWVEEEFWRPALNPVLITLGVTVVSLTFGTLGGYALARSNHPTPSGSFWPRCGGSSAASSPGR